MLVGGVIFCHRLLKGRSFNKWKESLKRGQIISCVCPAAEEQKVGVSHGGRAQGGSNTFWDVSPVKKCWSREFGGTRLLQHKELSSCSGTEGPQSAKCLWSPGPESWVHCVPQSLPPAWTFLFCWTRCQHSVGPTERRCPFVEVWHSILLSEAGDLLWGGRDTFCLVLPEEPRWNQACDNRVFFHSLHLFNPPYTVPKPKIFFCGR